MVLTGGDHKPVLTAESLLISVEPEELGREARRWLTGTGEEGWKKRSRRWLSGHFAAGRSIIFPHDNAGASSPLTVICDSSELSVALCRDMCPHHPELLRTEIIAQ